MGAKSGPQHVTVRPTTIAEGIILTEMRKVTASGEAKRIGEAAMPSLGEVAGIVGIGAPQIGKWEHGEVRVADSDAGERYVDLIQAWRAMVGPQPAEEGDAR